MKKKNVLEEALETYAQQASKPVIGKILLEDLGVRMCAWPTEENDEGVLYYCGSPLESDLPYCNEHCNLSYVRSRKKLSDDDKVYYQKDDDDPSEAQ